jgi:NTE family protein
MSDYLPDSKKNDSKVKELMSWGCSSVMHIIQLTINKVAGEDQMKDIDFTITGVSQRSETGYRETLKAIESQIWNKEHDLIEGVLIHSQFN